MRYNMVIFFQFYIQMFPSNKYVQISPPPLPLPLFSSDWNSLVAGGQLLNALRNVSTQSNRARDVQMAINHLEHVRCSIDIIFPV